MDFKLILLIFFIICLGVIAWLLGRPKKLPRKIIEKYSAKILQTSKLDPAFAILESHKIFVEALSLLFSDKKLTAAQKISKVQKRLPNSQKIWTHHRLRNRIAHETDTRASKFQAERARQDFVIALKSLGE